MTIDSVYDPGAVVYDASRPSAGDLAFVVAHGFTGDVDRPHVRRVVEALTRHAAVVTFSFRGHGASGGRSTVGDREVLDLAAAVRWARELGHTRVATIGFSMGGSVVLRHAALYGETGVGGAEVGPSGRTGAGTDAVVSVSAPARWYYRGTPRMRRLHWMVTRPEGRLVSRYGFRTRIHHEGWDPVPMSPVEAVAHIAPTPLLIVHGDLDGYFPSTTPACWPRRPVTTANSGWSPEWGTPSTRPPRNCWPGSVTGPPRGRASLVDAHRPLLPLASRR